MKISIVKFKESITKNKNKEEIKGKENEEENKKKGEIKKTLVYKTIVSVLIFIVIYKIVTFFVSDEIKNLNSVNNVSSQGIVENILNIASYDVIAEIEITGNKTINKYLVNQKYTMPDIITQEILEPENMLGIKITKIGNELRLENTKLNIISIYENYNYISENILDLCKFLENFKNQGIVEYVENDKYIILELENLNQTLYIDKLTGNPHSMQIKDANENNIINILYTRVEFNLVN